MTPEEICRILNENAHDGKADWELDPITERYESAAWPITPLSPASAEIIAQHYKANADRRAFIANHKDRGK